MNEPGTAITYPLRNPVAGILTKPEARAEIERMLRPGDSFDRIVVEVFHAASQNAEILECTPQSIISAVARAVSTGLVIGDTVHLVPFNVKVSKKNEADRWEKRLQAITDYKGKAELLIRAGAARRIDAHCVYKNETFRYTQGTNPSIEHVPIMAPDSRGELVGAYAIAFAANGRFQFVVLSTDEIDEIRQKHSKQWKGGKLPYWYAQKTCVHRLAKLLPKSAELAKVLAMFDREAADENELAQPIEIVEPIRIAGNPNASGASPESSPGRPIDAQAPEFPFPFGSKLNGKPLRDISTQTLEEALMWAEEQEGAEREKLAPFMAAAATVLKGREAAA